MSDDTGTITVEVDVMLVGQLPVANAYLFRPPGRNLLTALPALLRPGDEFLRTPLLAFAVRHPSVGPILIDTGLHPDAGEDLGKDYGRFLSSVFRKLRPADETYEEQLRGLGIEPSEVERVVMTHLHVDHTGGMRLLPKAKFVCSREEWAAATGRAAVRNGYASTHLPSASRMRFVDFARDGEPYGPFAQTIDLLGDGSIRLVSTPGHTRGHLSVLLRLAGGRQVLLIGDAVYTLRSLREEILPLLTVGDQLYLSSLRQLKAYAEREPDATLIPFHDPAAWRALGEATAPVRERAARTQ
jgi:N-acyl homoserine lactone hydrolase